MRNPKSSRADVYPLDDPNLDWMRRGPNNRHLAVACRLPDCTKLIVRPKSQLEVKKARRVQHGISGRETQNRDLGEGKRGRHKWFCSPQHAAEYRRRRAALDAAIAALDAALSPAQPTQAGQYSTEDLRRHARDRTYLQHIRSSYERLHSSAPVTTKQRAAAALPEQ